MNLRKVSIAIGMFVLVVAVAWLLGAQAGNLVTKSKTKDYQKQRRKQTKQILEEMGTIKVGDTLTDFALEDLNLELFRLSELVKGRTLITFFKPDCGACERQIELMSELEALNKYSDRFILISGSNPLYLKAFVETNDLPWRILYDSDEMVQDAYAINIAPFGIVVGTDLVVRQIIVGTPTNEELLAIIK